MAPTTQELQDEERRLRWVRLIVSFTSSVIAQGSMTRREGEALVEAARARILDLFPGSERTYEIVYARRFERLLQEYTTDEGIPRGVVIPFPPLASQ